MQEGGEGVKWVWHAAPSAAATAPTTHAPPAAGCRRLQGSCTCECRVRGLLPACRLLLLPATRLLQGAQGVGVGHQVVSVSCPLRSGGCRHSAPAAHALTCWAPHSPALLCCTLPPACLFVSALLQLLGAFPSCTGLRKLQEPTPGSSGRVAGLAQVSKDSLFRTVGGAAAAGESFWGMCSLEDARFVLRRA